MTLLGQLRDYVRTIAESDPENALSIIESAGMSLKKLVLRVKALISVVEGPTSGTVVCEAKAPGGHANYFWFYSLDQKSWTSVPEAMKSKITISGLTPGQTYYFRHYIMTRKGNSDMSQIVSLMVK